MKINCIIDKTLESVKSRKKKVSVLVRYFKMRYKINVDESVISSRTQKIKVA